MDVFSRAPGIQVIMADLEHPERNRELSVQPFWNVEQKGILHNGILIEATCDPRDFMAGKFKARLDPSSGSNEIVIDIPRCATQSSRKPISSTQQRLPGTSTAPARKRPRMLFGTRFWLTQNVRRSNYCFGSQRTWCSLTSTTLPTLKKVARSPLATIASKRRGGDDPNNNGDTPKKDLDSILINYI